MNKTVLILAFILCSGIAAFYYVGNMFGCADAAPSPSLGDKQTSSLSPAPIIEQAFPFTSDAQDASAPASPLSSSGALVPGTQHSFAGIAMVWIPPGTFIMGSPDSEKGRYDSEGPQRQVTINQGFWLGQYPVTQAQWEKVMGNNPSQFKGAEHPVERVSWNEVQSFIQKLNAQVQGAFRLPTEAEWEYACRAGTTTRFYWGEDPDETLIKDYTWYSDNSGGATHPVGRKRPNPWNLYDMNGNVWEWCEDDWHGNFNDAPTDGSAWVDTPRSSHRVGRGGGWSSSPRRSRSAFRIGDIPTAQHSGLSFRLALFELKQGAW